MGMHLEETHSINSGYNTGKEKMKNKRKIEILSGKIKLLETENKELKKRTEQLNGLPDVKNGIKNDSRDLADELLLSLEASIKEYEKLTSECRDIKEAYTRSVKEMHRLTSKYKKDIRRTKINQITSGIRR